MRKNIFELLNNQFDLEKEIRVIHNLFCSRLLASAYNRSVTTTIREYVDKNCLAYWDYRGTSTSTMEMINRLGLSSILNGDFGLRELLQDEDKLLVYLEFIRNICELPLVFTSPDARIIRLPNYNILVRNIDTVVSKIGYEFYSPKEEKRFILIKSNPKASAIAEIVEDDDLSTLIMEYNSIGLSKDIEGKKKILHSMSNYYEEVSTKIEDAGFKSLKSDAGKLLNNLNIRHNNISGPKEKESTKELIKNGKIEEWYDITYETLLACFTVADYVDLKSDIKQLSTD